MQSFASLRARMRNRGPIFLHDVAWVPVAVYVAYVLRFMPEDLPADSWNGFLWLQAVATPVFAASYYLFGLHRGTWRFVSFSDLTRLFKSVLLGTMVTTAVVFLTARAHGIPRSVLLLLPVVLTMGLVGPRVAMRWLAERTQGPHQAGRQRALIVGSGPVAEQLIRRLLRDGAYLPAAIVTTDKHMVGKEIHGVRIAGRLRDTGAVLHTHRIEGMILAAPEGSSAELSEVIARCVDAKVACHTVPQRALNDQGALEEIKLRPIAIEDLLCREPIVLDREGISSHLRGQRVLVTGGGGSIGSELSCQIAAQEPERLVIFDHSEFNLYQIEQDLHVRFPRLNIVPVLGDVKDPHRVEAVFGEHRPAIIFHAAAYKHVPLLESNPLQAVQNNIFGTRTVADAANRHGCAQFVLISTDKAVNPTNVMGASKRAAEIYCQNLDARSETQYVTTRFGNVLGSVGSVVPLFNQQIAQGGPVTVTHPEIRRYFMTIPEAVSLILQASAMGRGGEIFVLDMGEPVKIKDLAEQMIRLAGYRPYEDIPIVFSGLRPGEKLFEELLHDSEALIGTSNPKLLLGTHRPVDWEWLNRSLEQLQRIVEEGRRPDVVRGLRTIVPEYAAVAPAPPEDPPALRHLRVVK